MKPAIIQTYLRTLERDLWLRGLHDPQALAEIESHLIEAVEREQSRGLTLEEAQAAALTRFGDVKIVACAFEKERKAPMQKILLIVGLLAGLFFAYVDALPNWDDTGILAGMLLLTSGLLTLLGYRRPWMMALAVGLWIPLHDIFISHDWRMLLVLLIPLVGAYAGWAAHQVFRKTLKVA